MGSMDVNGATTRDWAAIRILAIPLLLNNHTGQLAAVPSTFGRSAKNKRSIWRVMFASLNKQTIYIVNIYIYVYSNKIPQ